MSSFSSALERLLSPLVLLLLLQTALTETSSSSQEQSHFHTYSEPSATDTLLWQGRDKALKFVPSLPHSRYRRSPLDSPPESSLGSTEEPSPSSSEDDSSSDLQDLSRGDNRKEFESKVISGVDVSDKMVNETLSNNNENITETGNDTRKYYKFESANFSDHWTDLDKMAKVRPEMVQEHPMLSRSYRRAATININFPFPFYGHKVVNITIATGGFLYTGQYVHSWLAATQYIAPLMANFDTSHDKNAKIRFADTGEALIVEWMNVHLQGQNTQARDNYNSSNGETVAAEQGPFTFQVKLMKNGDIVFVYKTVPLLIDMITDEDHPVKVGLSDAYIIDRTIFFVRRKTIYEYHRVSLKNEFHIANETAVYFKALPTCNRYPDCRSCLDKGKSEEEYLEKEGLQCKWCPRLGKCSDGMDRNRQEWIKDDCDNSNVLEMHQCAAADAEAAAAAAANAETREEYAHADYNDGGHVDIRGGAGRLPMAEDVTAEEMEDGSKIEPHHAGIATLVILAFLMTSCVAWFGYAYFVPHSWSGQLLIKYRPSRWHWLSGGTQYTAASIHM